MSQIDISRIVFSYINLRHRPDRNEHMQRELARVKIPATRFEAFQPDDWIGPPSSVQRMHQTPGAIGCYMSHRALINSIRDTNRIAGIFEDDALICSDFWERMKYIEANFTEEWDIFWLGSTYHCNPPVWHADTLGRDFEQTEVKHIHRVFGAFAMEGYLVNGRRAAALVQTLDANLHLGRGLDHLLILLQPQLKCYCFTPGMVFQMDDYSDIGLGETKFSNFYRLGAYVFTDRLKDFDYARWDWAEGSLDRVKRDCSHA